MQALRVEAGVGGELLGRRKLLLDILGRISYKIFFPSLLVAVVVGGGSGGRYLDCICGAGWVQCVRIFEL